MVYCILFKSCLLTIKIICKLTLTGLRVQNCKILNNASWYRAGQSGKMCWKFGKTLHSINAKWGNGKKILPMLMNMADYIRFLVSKISWTRAVQICNGKFHQYFWKIHNKKSATFGLFGSKPFESWMAILFKSIELMAGLLRPFFFQISKDENKNACPRKK